MSNIFLKKTFVGNSEEVDKKVLNHTNKKLYKQNCACGKES